MKAAVAAAGARGPKDMGAVMKALLPKVQGRAEGKAVSDAVKAQLPPSEPERPEARGQRLRLPAGVSSRARIGGSQARAHPRAQD